MTLEPPAELQVVHVVGERYLMAGFPRGAWRFATSARQLDPFMIAVIEGHPMRARHLPMSPPAGVPHALWTTAAGYGRCVPPNRFDPDQPLAPGDEVSIGGFFIPAGGATAVTFLDVPPSVVSGRLVIAPAAGAPSLGCVMLPPGRYHPGFLGGPVASRRGKDDIRVWGIVVAVPPPSVCGPPGTWAVVQRLHSAPPKQD